MATTIESIPQYAYARNPDALRRQLCELEDERRALTPAALERRIALAHRIGCIRYALGKSSENAFADAAERIPDLVRGRRIAPSMAIACWGIADLAQRDDLLLMLAERADPARLGSQHGIPRYLRMLTRIFATIQSRARLDDERAIAEHVAGYEREFHRGRTHRAFAKWSRTLLAIAAADDAETGGRAIENRCRYLDESYRESTDLLDHEGLLDVHGIGAIAALRMGGIHAAGRGPALPNRPPAATPR